MMTDVEVHEPDVRAPQWEKQWCVVDNEDWPCAVERRRRMGDGMSDRLQTDIRELRGAEPGELALMSELTTRTALANRVDHVFVARSALANAHRHARRISFLQPNPDELQDALAAIYRAHANGTCADAKCIAYGRGLILT